MRCSSQVQSDITRLQRLASGPESPTLNYLPRVSPFPSPNTEAKKKIQQELARLSTPASIRRTGEGRLFWEDAEVKELEKLVAMYGVGNWVDIHYAGFVYKLCLQDGAKHGTVFLKKLIPT